MTPPPPTSHHSISKDLQHLNIMCEVYRRHTFEKWPVACLNKNQLSAAGFYYTKLSDVVCCAFCGA